MALTIDNYEVTADLFTFPNNPYVFDDSIEINSTDFKTPYGNKHIITTGGGIDPKTIVLNGQFNGSSKRDYYNDLARHVTDAKLKKLTFASDRFYICLGKSLKQTNTGGRTNFIDYVASFVSPIGILFSTTQRTSGTNAGDCFTYVEKITGTSSSGAVFTISDNHGTTLSCDPGTTGAIVVTFVTLETISGGVKNVKYAKVTVGGVEQKRTITGDWLRIDPTENVSTIVTTGDIGSMTVYFRDGYLG